MKVVFVCLGNICRSPMGEFIFKKMLEEDGLADKVEVISRGTSDCEAGSPIYPPALRCLKSHGVEGKHTAQKITADDIKSSGYILCMDSGNRFDLSLMAGERADKIHRLCDFTARPRDVADPWYTLDFERAYRDIFDGCRAFLEFLKSENKL